MAIQGALDSYNQTVGVIVDMDPMVDILPVDEAVTYRWIPEGDPAESTKVEWLNEELTGQEVTLEGAVLIAATSFVLEAGQGTLIRVGDVLEAKDQDAATPEQVLVTAVSTDTLTVVRSFGTTTAEAWADGTVFTLISQYRAEKSAPEDGRAVDRTTDHNFTQIGQEEVSVSRTTRKVKRYGMGDPYTHEVEKKFRELVIRFNRNIISGRRVQGSGADAKKRSMGGVFFYATSNAQSGVKANIETVVNTALEDIWRAGGRPKTLLCSAAWKRQFASLNASRIRYNDATAGGVRGETVDRYVSDFGDITLVMDRYFPKHKAAILQQEYVKHRTLDGLQHELLAKTTDGDDGHIVCEKSFELKNPKAHAVLTLTDL